MVRAWPVLFAIVAACGFDPRGDGGDPPLDAIGGDAPDAVAGCVPGCDAAGTMVTTCSAGTPVTEVCAQGCGPAPTPHCRVFSPSNGAIAADLVGVTAALVVPAGRLFLLDTDDGSIDSYDRADLSAPPLVVRAAGDGLVTGLGFRRAEQGTGQPGLGSWAVTSLTVTGTLRVVGARAAIILAGGAIAVVGAIDVGAGQRPGNLDCRECAGAGGGTGATRTAAATGCAPGGAGSYDLATFETGGAGGGMSTPGANGGDAGASGGAAATIATCAGPTLIPLGGGGGGGRGGYDTGGMFGGVSGGGGGGGLQLSSLTSLTVTGTGDLYAGGLGGAGSATNYGGGGGGAGGGLLLEAPIVTIADTANVTANGGGGGSGRLANVGDRGNRSTSRAAGGAGDGIGSDDGRGGVGGVAAAVGTASLLPTPGHGSVDGTGGGGASAGRIRVNTGPATTPVIAGTTTISPAPSIGTRPLE